MTLVQLKLQEIMRPGLSSGEHISYKPGLEMVVDAIYIIQSTSF